LTVTLPGGTPQPALTALKEWVRFAIRTPNGAVTDADGLSAANGGLNATTVAQGRRLFFQTGCQKCHGGTKWTISNKDFTSPPAASEIFTEAGAANAIGTQFLNRFLSDIGSFNLNVDGSNQIPGQPQIGATEKANAAGLADTDPAAKDALGIDHNGDGAGKGFNIPSLLGIWALQPYYHNGACETLACVMNNVTHRTAGLRSGQADLFTDPTNRTRVIEFLKTIDSETDVPTNLYIEAHDIFIDPPTVIKGTTVQVGANISLFGTTADLANLAADSGVSSITVRCTCAPANAGTPETVDVALPLTDFTQDFGQATVTTNWTASTTAPNLAQVTVTVDPANQVVESNETDNTANRRIRILNPPPDTTPPQITKVIISPNTTFDPEPQITQSRDVKVQIIATDDKELKSFCIVRYSYDVPRRRWVEESCFFQDLPAPTAANTFVVDTRLRPSEGVGYVFVWVKDAAGNISRRSGPNDPSFDFINFIPAANIRLNRNDSRLFRLTLNTGTTTFTFKPQFGDIDVSVFQGFGANAPRCALSANNGPVNEIVSVPGGACTGTQFQIEVFAIANSRFTIETAQSIINASQSSNAVVEQAAAFGDKPLVGGPPAIQTAIGDEGDDLFLPIILK
jgi:hypothetical protein